MRHTISIIALVLMVFGCSVDVPDLDSGEYRCRRQSDCAAGYVCSYDAYCLTETNPVERAFVDLTAAQLNLSESLKMFNPGIQQPFDVDASITKNLSVMRHEVTDLMWQTLMVDIAEVEPLACPDCPKTNVSYFDALRFANALSAQQGLTQCFDLSLCNNQLTCDVASVVNAGVVGCDGYRLPTEVEWQLIAMAGQAEHLPGLGFEQSVDDVFASTFQALGDIAWFASNSNETLQPVMTKDANQLGVFDMSGNASEWVLDAYTESPAGGQDALTTSGDGTNDVVTRGGSYTTSLTLTGEEPEPSALLFSTRYFSNANDSEISTGFRLVRSLP